MSAPEEKEKRAKRLQAKAKDKKNDMKKGKC